MANIFLYYVNWRNTKGNHAGMAHFCKLLKEYHSNIFIYGFNVIAGKGGKYWNRIMPTFYTIYFLIKLKNTDTIIYMEYLTQNSSFQEYTAKVISTFKPKIKQYGLVHLSKNHLIEQHKNIKNIKKKISILDKVYVMGSSLEKFLISIGINPKKIYKIYHYVDHQYYFPLIKHVNKRLKVICIGNLKRNFNQLKKIVIKCPEIDFIICQGVLNLKELFSDYKNVSLYCYVEENKLRELMQKSDVSLNVMKDTIGSNVITTSMACGLAMVVSDVGSIRDYCDDANTIFCKNLNEYVEALRLLDKDREELIERKKKSNEKSLKFSFDRVGKILISP
jgi:glycosyltransferase involved in cell wall biosynthesis